MKRILFIVLLSASCLLPTATGFSQDYLGFSNSLFAGVNGIDVNPAFIVNNPRKWDVTLVGVNFMGGNNFFGFRKSALEHTGKTFTGDYPAFSDDDFVNNYLSRRNVKSISVFAAANVTLPSFMFTRAKHKDAFAFTAKTRAFANVDGVKADLANLLIDGVTDSTMFGQTLSTLRLSAQAMIWNEYGITYGRTIKESGNERLSVAGRAKLLQGLYAMYLYLDKVEYNFLKDDSLLILSTMVNYGHSTNLEFNPDALKFGFGSRPGIGLDLGATYEFYPLTDVRSRQSSSSNTTSFQHAYRYKLGFAIQDLGWMGFLKPAHARNFEANLLDPLDLNSLQGSGDSPLADADDTLYNKYGMMADDKKFRMNLPTRINMTGDYYLGHNLHLNSTLSYAFQFKRNADKVHEVTTISVTPRWDWKFLGLYVPVSYNKHSHVRLGASARVGPLIVGMADVLPLISKRDVYAVDFHVMLKVPHIHLKKKDKNKRSKSKFDTKRDQPKKKKERKVKSNDTNKEKKKRIFPKVRLFKKKNKHDANPDEREKIIYFQL